MTKYEWEDFANKAKQNIQSMKEEYEKENYATSAFECQQGIEKIIKAILLRNKVQHHPNKYGHDLILKLWNDICKTYDSSKWPREHSETLRQLFEIVDDIFKKSLDKKKSWKLIWWKYSLNIKLSEDENKKLIPIIKKITDQQTNAMKLFDSMLNVYFFKEFNQTKIRKNMPPEISLRVDEIKRKIPNPQNESSIKALQELPILFFCLLKLMHKKNPRSRDMKIGFYKEDIRPILTMWLFGFTDLLLRLYSHEDIGRYPCRLDDGTYTEDLYKNNKEALKNLEDEAERAFSELHKAALSLI